MHYDPSDALARIDNDTGLLSMLITVFIKEVPNYISRLEAAKSSQNLNALGDAAHNVKGASAAIGFEEARSMAEKLEVACRQSGVTSIAHFENSTNSLTRVLENCQPVLQEWLGRAR